MSISATTHMHVYTGDSPVDVTADVKNNVGDRGPYAVLAIGGADERLALFVHDPAWLASLARHAMVASIRLAEAQKQTAAQPEDDAEQRADTALADVAGYSPAEVGE